MNRRKICFVTGTRADFGLMQWIMHEIQQDENLELQIIATGMHLSHEFGLTYKAIEEQGFSITKRVEMLLSSDSSVGITKSMGLGIISFSEVFEELRPDLVVVLGDRFEIFSAVTAAMIARIPVGHIHGGEATEGLIDESIRHSITKMAHLHFTATDAYAKRVIQLGEQPERVFHTGTPGLDNIGRMKLLGRHEFESILDFKLSEQNILVTFHPVTLEKKTAYKQFDELLSALNQFPGTNVIFTMPNADTDGRILQRMVDDYVMTHKGRARAYKSLGQLNYLSALKNVQVVLGNSSSGLIEAPSFKIPTINIGDRQKGRIKAETIIDCDPNTESIVIALKKAFDPRFRKQIKNAKNPYGEAGASSKIKEILKTFPLRGILKKSFYDL